MVVLIIAGIMAANIMFNNIPYDTKILPLLYTYSTLVAVGVSTLVAMGIVRCTGAAFWYKKKTYPVRLSNPIRR